MSFKPHKTKEDICPICGEFRTIEVGTQSELLKVKGEEIGIEARVQRCTVCHEIFANGDEEEENIQRAYCSYRHKHELLQPEEIQSIREQYELSQKAMSLVLGWGAVTIHRYESGGIQDQSHNDILLLLKNEPANLRMFFDKNKSKLPTGTARKLEKLFSRKFKKKDPYQTKLIAKKIVSTGEWEMLGALDTELNKLYQHEGFSRFSKIVSEETHSSPKKIEEDDARAA